MCISHWLHFIWKTFLIGYILSDKHLSMVTLYLINISHCLHLTWYISYWLFHLMCIFFHWLHWLEGGGAYKPYEQEATSHTALCSFHQNPFSTWSRLFCWTVLKKLFDVLTVSTFSGSWAWLQRFLEAAAGSVSVAAPLSWACPEAEGNGASRMSHRPGWKPPAKTKPINDSVTGRNVYFLKQWNSHNIFTINTFISL